MLLPMLCCRMRPVRAKDTINQLKEEISNLSKLVEKGAGLSVGQENMVKELIRVRDELTRKTDEQGQTIAVSVWHCILRRPTCT